MFLEHDKINALKRLSHNSVCNISAQARQELQWWLLNLTGVSADIDRGQGSYNSENCLLTLPFLDEDPVCSYP